MPKFNHPNFGDVQNFIFAKGVITAVDSENDLADVTVEGYRDGSDTPLFYHCEPDSEEASNGSIEGAAAAFSVDDEVIVMLEVRGAPVRIVGFVDGIKSCLWEPWNTDPEDEYNLETSHPWHLYSSPTGRTPFTMSDGMLHYSVQTTAWPSPLDSINDGMWINFDSEDYIEASEVYIKIECSVSGSVYGVNEFYNYFMLKDEAGVRYFITFNGSNDRYIHATWTKAHPWPEIIDEYISLPGATLTNFNIENDGTVPIVLPETFNGKVVSVAIDTGYDELITSVFEIDFINFK